MALYYVLERTGSVKNRKGMRDKKQVEQWRLYSIEHLTTQLVNLPCVLLHHSSIDILFTAIARQCHLYGVVWLMN